MTLSLLILRVNEYSIFTDTGRKRTAFTIF